MRTNLPKDNFSGVERYNKVVPMAEVPAGKPVTAQEGVHGLVPPRAMTREQKEVTATRRCSRLATTSQ